HGDKVFAVNKKNEFLVADCGSLEVADLHEYEKYDQLWPVLWAGKVFLRSASSIYEITVGGDLREVWSHKRLFLLPEMRVIEIDGGWRDKKISITCFDSDQG